MIRDTSAAGSGSGGDSTDLTNYSTTVQIDLKDDAILDEAKEFTTDEIAKIPTPDLSALPTTAQVDSKDQAILTAAKAHADTNDNGHSAADRAYSDAEDGKHSRDDRAYADTQDAAHSASDRAYTDAKVAAIDFSIYSTTDVIDSKIDTAKTEAIGAGQELYAIWQAKHGDPTSTTNNASRPVAGFSGTVSWDATNENVSIGSNSGAGTIYWQNASIDFRRCALTAEVSIPAGGTNNRGRTFRFNLGSSSTNLLDGNALEIVLDLDGFDRGAPPGSRQIYIFNRVSRTYLGSKILNNEITINQKLEFKAVLDVQEITLYLDGVEVLHLDNVTFTFT